MLYENWKENYKSQGPHHLGRELADFPENVYLLLLFLLL